MKAKRRTKKIQVLLSVSNFMVSMVTSSRTWCIINPHWFLCDIIWNPSCIGPASYVMRCDQAKWVWTRKKWNLGFHLQYMHKFQSYIMLKLKLKLDLWIQRYSYFSDAQNIKIQRKLNAIIGSIYKTIIASSDSFCLITSHIFLSSSTSRLTGSLCLY